MVGFVGLMVVRWSCRLLSYETDYCLTYNVLSEGVIGFRVGFSVGFSEGVSVEFSVWFNVCPK